MVLDAPQLSISSGKKGPMIITRAVVIDITKHDVYRKAQLEPAFSVDGSSTSPLGGDNKGFDKSGSFRPSSPAVSVSVKAKRPSRKRRGRL